MSTIAVIANDWPAVVGELPAKLAAAIRAFDEAAVAYVDAASITDKNVGEAVTGLAQTLAVEDAFSKAKKAVLDALARRVLFAAADAVPELMEQATPEFEAAVAEFCAAVEALPPDHSPAALIAAGSGAVDAYHAAATAQGKLHRYAGWLASIASLPGYNHLQSEKVLRLIRPTTRAEYQLLVDAVDGIGGSELDPMFIAAVEAGLHWELHDPKTADALADELNSQPIEKRRIRFA